VVKQREKLEPWEIALAIAALAAGIVYGLSLWWGPQG
jgi:hypothetical protein